MNKKKQSKRPKLKNKEDKRRILARIIKDFQKYHSIIVARSNKATASYINKLKMNLILEEIDASIIFGNHALVKKAIEWFTKSPRRSDRDADLAVGLEKKFWLSKLLPFLKGNIALILTNTNFDEFKPILKKNSEDGISKAGDKALEDIYIEEGPTFLDAGKIDIFHKLNIPVIIERASIKVTRRYLLCEKGKKIQESIGILMRILDYKHPTFLYKKDFQMIAVVDKSGVLYEEQINMERNDILNIFTEHCSKLIGMSVGLNLVNQASVPYIIRENFLLLMSLGYSSGHIFKEIQKIRDEVKAHRKRLLEQASENNDDEPVEEEPEDVSSVSLHLFSDTDSD
jgi:large subunit ribosomal protein LP0